MNEETNHAASDLQTILEEAATSERESLRRTWDAVESYPEDPAFLDMWRESVWQSIEQRLPDESESVDAQNPVLSTFWRWAVAAVVVAVVLGLAILAQPISYSSAPGQTLALTLPDGSQVDLNSGSSLTHPRWFVTARNVQLTGEAFFNVVADDDPFVIETFNARVRVVGTRFNVRARDETTVSVVSGIVEVSPLSAETSVSLAPSEHAVVRLGEVARAEDLKNDDVLAWRRGDLVFNDASLESVAAELERRFAISVHLTGRSLAGRRVSTNLHQPLTAEGVIKDICEALHLRYRRTTDGYEILAEASS